MEAFATYLMKSSVWLTGFALVYALFLRNERFFTLNRIYLVSGILFSMIFPLFTWHYTVLIPIVPSVEISEPQVQGITIPEESFNPQNLLLLAYLAGIAYLMYRILRQTLPVFRIIRKSEKRLYSSAKLIRTDAYPASFSFFSFVFVNPSIDETETNEIVNHELEHIRQQHWIDLLLFEILRTMQWFNPATWLYGHLIRQNHEYLADERALQRSSNPAIYRAALLNQLFGGPVISLANSFNYSLNKKRFNMMKQTISSPLRKLKLLVVLPLIAGVFYAFAAPEYKFVQPNNSSTDLTQTENTIKGKVTDENGKPLKSATVIISGKTIGTITDLSGNFTLKLTDDSPIVVSYVGYETLQVAPDYSKDMQLVMKRKTFEINFDKLPKENKAPSTDKIPEVSLIFINGIESSKAEMDKLNPEEIQSVNILKDENEIKKYGDRGKAGVIDITLKTNNQPLYIVDGKTTNLLSMNKFSHDSIESIDVLKGESAKAAYGEKGKNGVILIRTKKVESTTPNSPNDLKVTGSGNDQIANKPNTGINISSAETLGIEPKPLLVVDGIIAENQNIDKIDPETIESVNVIKNEVSTNKYGEKGKNGVVEITLKHPEEKAIIVESLPEFPGGVEALKNFVASSLQYPSIALKNGIQGQVVVGFVVGKTGEITNVKIKSGVDPSLDNEALRIVKSMPRWIPGKQNGQGVDVFYKLPINFNLPPIKSVKKN